MANCTNRHRYLPDLALLPDGQAGSGRHKCAGCAYEQGYNDAFDGNVSHLNFDALNDSQAGTGRHKDTEAAYNLGYTHGTARRQAIV